MNHIVKVERKKNDCPLRDELIEHRKQYIVGSWLYPIYSTCHNIPVEVVVIILIVILLFDLVGNFIVASG